MTSFQITDPTVGSDFGFYEAATKSAALDDLAREIGYSDYKHMEDFITSRHKGSVLTFVVTKVAA